MTIKKEMENLIEKMLDGHILLNEALFEFEKHYIQKALKRNKKHLSNTAEILGIHRNTLSKRVSIYDNSKNNSKPLVKRRNS